jgi:hypothetical protein
MTGKEKVMANRNLLVKTKLSQFKEWVENKANCQIKPTKGGYECLRFKLNNTTHIIFENHRSMHLSLQSQTVYLVRQFLDENKHKQRK